MPRAFQVTRVKVDCCRDERFVNACRVNPKNFFAELKRRNVYEVRPRSDKRGVDLISDALPFRRLWYGEPNAIRDAIDHAKFHSRLHDVVISVYDEAGNVIETHKHRDQFKE